MKMVEENSVNFHTVHTALEKREFFSRQINLVKFFSKALIWRILAK